MDAGLIREAIRSMVPVPQPAGKSGFPVLTISTAELDLVRQRLAGNRARRFWRRTTRLAASVVFILLSASLLVTIKRKPPDISETLEPSPRSTITTVPAEYIEVAILPNDTLSGMCIKHLGKTLDDHVQAQIMKLNPQISNPSFLRAGKTLRLPVAPTPKHETRPKGPPPSDGLPDGR
jgi:hypothetical protein